MHYLNLTPNSTRRLSGICATIAVVVSVLIVGLTALSCNETPKNVSVDKPRSQSATDLDPRLKNADSLVVVFYDDPFGADSLRYTRYYKQVSARPGDSLFNQLEKAFVLGEKKPCRGEGKIWCYSGGKIIQTLYFSTQCEECCFLYLIKDGNFYFSQASPEFLAWLGMEKSRLPK